MKNAHATLRSMKRRFVTLVAALAAFACHAADVYFPLSGFNISPASNRWVVLQAKTPIAGDWINYTSTVAGGFWASNLIAPADYEGVVKQRGSSPERRFQISLASNDVNATLYATNRLSVVGVQTWPEAGRAAWSIEAADRRYAPFGSGAPANGLTNNHSAPVRFASSLTLTSGLSGLVFERAGHNTNRIAGSDGFEVDVGMDDAIDLAVTSDGITVISNINSSLGQFNGDGGGLSNVLSSAIATNSPTGQPLSWLIGTNYIDSFSHHLGVITGNDGWFGYQVIANKSMYINAVARWVGPGNSNTHPVAVFDDAGNALSRTTVNPELYPTNDWAWVPLDKPVLIPAGKRFVIAGFEYGTGDHLYQVSTPTYYPGTNLTFRGGVSFNTFPNNYDGWVNPPLGYSVNFRYYLAMPNYNEIPEGYANNQTSENFIKVNAVHAGPGYDLQSEFGHAALDMAPYQDPRLMKPVLFVTTFNLVATEDRMVKWGDITNMVNTLKTNAFTNFWYGCDIDDFYYQMTNGAGALATTISQLQDGTTYSVARGADGAFLVNSNNFPMGLGAAVDHVKSNGLLFVSYYPLMLASRGSPERLEGQPNWTEFRADVSKWMQWGPDAMFMDHTVGGQNYDSPTLSIPEQRRMIRNFADAALNAQNNGEHRMWTNASRTPSLWLGMNAQAVAVPVEQQNQITNAMITPEAINGVGGYIFWGEDVATSEAAVNKLRKALVYRKYYRPGHLPNFLAFYMQNAHASPTNTYRSMLNCWAMACAHAAGDWVDMGNAPATYKHLWTNSDFYADIYQVDHAWPGYMTASNALGETYVRALSPTNLFMTNAVMFYNKSNNVQSMTVYATNLNLPEGTAFQGRDPWFRTNFFFTNSFTMTVIPTNTHILRVWPVGYRGEVNVKESPYNAVGDGVADDTLAFARALTNGIVRVPAGTYKTDVVNLSNNAVMYGLSQAHTHIKFNTGIFGSGDQYNGNFHFNSRRTNSFIVRGIDFDGQHSGFLAAAQAGTTNQPPFLSGVERNGIFFGTDTNNQSGAYDCSARNYNGHAFYIRGPDNAQSTFKNRATIQNCYLTNNYQGVLTDSGGTADYVELLGNKAVGNYNGFNLKGGNVLVTGNDLVANYIAINMDSGDRGHSSITANLINHSTIAALWVLNVGNWGAKVGENMILGGGDIRMYGASSNFTFRGNQIGATTIHADAGTRVLFDGNDFVSGWPAIVGSGIVELKNVYLPGNAKQSGDWEMIRISDIDVGGTGLSRTHVSSPGSDPHYFSDSWFQGNASSSSVIYSFGDIEPDVTNIVVRYTWRSESSNPTFNPIYWQDQWTTYFNDDVVGRSGGDNVTTNILCISNRVLNVQVSLPLRGGGTNSWKQLWLTAGVSTNTSGRSLVRGFYIKKQRMPSLSPWMFQNY